MLRKKLALLLSTSFKDVILNGVSPLSLPNAQANGLKYIKLFGKCEQTGTPTLDNPVPIMCNNGAVGNNWSSNLFDSSKATLNYYINSSGNEQYNANWVCTDYIEVVEGGTYRLTGVTSYGTSPRTGFYKADKTFVSQRSQSSSAFTIPEDKDIKYMRMSVYKASIDTATIQQKLETIETIAMNGQTATAQDLLSCCDDYVDEHNITTGEVIRKVEYRIIDGTENWVEYSGSSSTGYMYTLDNTQADPTTFVVMSTHFKGVRSNYAITNMVIGEAKCLSQSIYVCAAQDTVENFKTWLANQSSNGTPVVFVYAKATPTTETVTQQTNIQTVSGNNTLTITQASVDMLDMEVKYKAKG